MKVSRTHKKVAVGYIRNGYIVYYPVNTFIFKTIEVIITIYLLNYDLSYHAQAS